MRTPEAAPRYGAIILLAIAMGFVACLVAAPVLLTLLLVAGAGR